jgi:hypothetical protein
MARAGSSVKKRVWKKVIFGLIAGLVVSVSLVFWQRYKITAWYLEGNRSAKETTILFMLENARPIIERNLKMTLPEKIFSSMAGKRNEKERQTGALQDVRKFAELGFENHRLKFKDVHSLNSRHGFDVHGFSFALEWDRNNTNEVLSAFNVNFLKRELGEMRVNPDCSFFTELKLYVEKGARKD